MTNEINIPNDLYEELAANGLVEKFVGLGFDWCKQHIDWIESAKKDETRISRIERTIDEMNNVQFTM